ncbi:AAA family ATPase [Sphingobium sp. H39-3-25]|uniref:AAA family ATPase n=1 Tax=Sphingobium arseniciresistens TaxID=3030834 RepID=UPI0023BA2758|nr:AAA family ATPase [Sphingobium arseniciresistens]
MTKHSSITSGTPAETLLERAMDIYDFGAALRGDAAPKIDVPAGAPMVMAPPPAAPFAADMAGVDVPAQAAPALRAWSGPVRAIDRATLIDAGFVLPDGPVSGISEEFRILKRELLDQLRERAATDAACNGGALLVCSAHSGEGKTFCAVNLALSLAAEKDVDVLLVDADVANPSVLAALGLSAEGADDSGTTPGLMDVLADPALVVENVVIRTDIPSLAILPAGTQTNNDTEYLASARTQRLLASLVQGNPNRIVIFDSPPLLAASPAAVLAGHVAMALLVVRADRTSEAALRDAASMLKGCGDVRLILNSISFSTGGRRFGNYYGRGK